MSTPTWRSVGRAHQAVGAHDRAGSRVPGTAPAVPIPYPPTSSSWAIRVEKWVRHRQGRPLGWGSFRSVLDLKEAILDSGDACAVGRSPALDEGCPGDPAQSAEDPGTSFQGGGGSRRPETIASVRDGPLGEQPHRSLPSFWSCPRDTRPFASTFSHGWHDPRAQASARWNLFQRIDFSSSLPSDSPCLYRR